MVDISLELNRSDYIDVRLTETELKEEVTMKLCEICCRTFSNSNALRLHQVKTHSLVRGESDFALFHRRRVSKDPKRHYYCPIVGCKYNNCSYFDSYKLLHQHFLKVHGEKHLRRKISMPVIVNFKINRTDWTSHLRRVCSEPNHRVNKSVQTNDMNTYYHNSFLQHASSQTTQRTNYDFYPAVLHEYCDFDCQAQIASGVEFGTQITPSDMLNEDLNTKQSKAHDDFEFEDIWRNNETQTSVFTGNDVLTQTATDLMDGWSMTDWDFLI
ncbi:unnamed protein product [Thelazia callipaeda]|uniref:C2H2-type domain-containing protein n=1 Tax=Thelazia callipaeda TaxID=103827 RepID=A0A0N5D547_THECL|nr:unnamed protein product [Thelazia callipaeda]